MVMRTRRMGLIAPAAADVYLGMLRSEFAARSKPQPKQPKPVNAIRRYNGVEFSKRLLKQLDQGTIGPRVLQGCGLEQVEAG